MKVRDILIDSKAKRDLEPLLDNVVFRGGDVMTTSLICISSYRSKDRPKFDLG